MVDIDLLEYLENLISEERKQRFVDVLETRTRYLTVAIEDVYQLHNTSAVIRSCESFGIQDAHIIEGRFGKRLDKNIAMGAQQWVDVRRYGSTEECIDALKGNGYRIIATSPHNDSCFLEDFVIEQPTALFFGTEREGLSEQVLQNCDSFLKIPMTGFTESLNISVSAAIMLQHLGSQLRSSTLDWQLTESEKLEKRLDWTKKTIKSIDAVMTRYHVGKTKTMG